MTASFRRPYDPPPSPLPEHENQTTSSWELQCQSDKIRPEIAAVSFRETRCADATHLLLLHPADAALLRLVRLIRQPHSGLHVLHVHERVAVLDVGRAHPLVVTLLHEFAIVLNQAAFITYQKNTCPSLRVSVRRRRPHKTDEPHQLKVEKTTLNSRCGGRNLNKGNGLHKTRSVF